MVAPPDCDFCVTVSAAERIKGADCFVSRNERVSYNASPAVFSLRPAAERTIMTTEFRFCSPGLLSLCRGVGGDCDGGMEGGVCVRRNCPRLNGADFSFLFSFSGELVYRNTVQIKAAKGKMHHPPTHTKNYCTNPVVIAAQVVVCKDVFCQSAGIANVWQNCAFSSSVLSDGLSQP